MRPPTIFATSASRSLVVALLATAGPGCQDRPLDFSAGDPGLDDLVVKQSFETDLGLSLDLLFVVDDTPAGAPLRSTLATAYPRMAAALKMRNPGIVSLHAGFVAASGVAAPQSRGLACGLAAPAQYLVSESCGQATNFAGSMEDAFGCLADFATDDQAPAQPLATLRQTLSGQRDGVPDAGWGGFLRPNAGLLIVVVAGEDDASGGAGTLSAVSDFADFVRGLKADSNLVGVSVIEAAGCGDAGGVPPAPRLQQFVEAFGESGVYIDSCQADPILAIEWAVTASAVAPPSDCLAGIRDTDLATPGLQAECSVGDTVLTSAGWSPKTPLPSCQVSAPPCYTLTATDSFHCPSSSFLLTVDRGPGFCPADTTRTEIVCATCADPNDPACQPSGP